MKIQIAPSFMVDNASKNMWKRVEGCWTKDERPVMDVKLGLEVLEDRVHGWFLRPAKTLADSNHEMAAIHLVTPLIEDLEQRYRGVSSRGQEKEFFRAGAKRVFGDAATEVILDALWKTVRCGFAHQGFMGHGHDVLVAVHRGAAIQQDANDTVLICACGYISSIAKAYDDFVGVARVDDDQQRKFGKTWYDGLERCLGMSAFGMPIAIDDDPEVAAS